MVIRKFAEHYAMTWQQSYLYIKRYNGIAFLDECYDAEHTLSFDDTVEDVTRVCQVHGVDLRYA